MLRLNSASMILRISVLALPLIWGALSGTAQAQTAPAGATTPGAPAAMTPGATTPSATTPGVPLEPVPGVGEIRLDGNIGTVSPAAGSFVLEVASFTLTSGKTTDLTVPKPRNIMVNDQTLIHSRGVVQKLALGDLKAGLPVSVIGNDVGAGKDFPAREVTVNDKVTPRSPITPGDGMGDGGATGGGTLNSADINRLIAQQQEFARQIAALRAEIQQMKQAPSGTAVKPGVAQPGAPVEPMATVTRTQFNDALAALRREFADEIKRLRTDLDQVKAAQAAPPEPAEEPAEEAPAEEEPAEEAPAEEPAEEAPAEEVPAEEAPAAEEGAAEDNAGEDKPAPAPIAPQKPQPQKPQPKKPQPPAPAEDQ